MSKLRNKVLVTGVLPQGYDFGEFSVEIDFHTNREHEEHIERRIVFKDLPNEDLRCNKHSMNV
jgi:hypothetical protein